MIKEHLALTLLISAAGLFIYSSNRNRLFIKWTFLWLLITTAAFYSGNIWIFTLMAVAVCLLGTGKTASEKVTYYFLLLPVIPTTLHQPIPGLIPGINMLFELTYARILTLFILIPAYFLICQNKRRPMRKLFSLKADKFVVPFLILLSILSFRNPSFTEGLRHSFYFFIDAFIPYFVISRSIDSIENFREFFSAILFSAVILAVVGIFEGVRGWLLYSHLDEYLNVASTGSHMYLFRESLLRVRTTFTHPIPFGFFMTMAVGIMLYMRPTYLRQKTFYWISLFLLLGALFCTVSRGPWIGCTLLFVTFFLFQVKGNLRKILVPILLTGGCMGILLLSPLGQSFMKVLPFVESEHYGTVSYRMDLVAASMAVIKENPVFGTPYFKQTDEMEEMRQGEGIIDIVNAYLAYALQYGVVALLFFVVIIVDSLRTLFFHIRSKLVSANSNVVLLGQVLFSILLAMAVMFATMGMRSFIPFYWWSLVGLSTGFLVTFQKTPEIYVSPEVVAVGRGKK